jgi:hypothetical protein
MQISKYDKINDMTFPRGKISLYQIVKGLAMNNFIKTQDSFELDFNFSKY